MKKCSQEKQTLRAGCSKAEPNILASPQTPFLGAWDGQNLISWRWSLPLPINPVWWGSMNTISSYRGNRPTHTPTHTQTNPRHDRLQYTAWSAMISTNERVNVHSQFDCLATTQHQWNEKKTLITDHLDPVLSASQPHGSGTNSLSAFAKPSHFLLLNAILRLTFFQSAYPTPSDPPSNAPWFFNRLQRYISSVLTYLLTHRCCSTRNCTGSVHKGSSRNGPCWKVGAASQSSSWPIVAACTSRSAVWFLKFGISSTSWQLTSPDSGVVEPSGVARGQWGQLPPPPLAENPEVHCILLLQNITVHGTPHSRDYTHKQYDTSKSNILVQQATGITHY